MIVVILFNTCVWTLCEIRIGIENYVIQLCDDDDDDDRAWNYFFFLHQRERLIHSNLTRTPKKITPNDFVGALKSPNITKIKSKKKIYLKNKTLVSMQFFFKKNFYDLAKLFKVFVYETREFRSNFVMHLSFIIWKMLFEWVTHTYRAAYRMLLFIEKWCAFAS
jgi:hypothetical protein